MGGGYLHNLKVRMKLQADPKNGSSRHSGIQICGWIHSQIWQWIKRQIQHQIQGMRRQDPGDQGSLSAAEWGKDTRVDLVDLGTYGASR